MKKTSFAIIASFLAITASQAATYYWGSGTNSGGSGTWDTVTAHFSTNSTGPFDVVWDNSTMSSDTAQFSGTAGTVTVDSGGINCRRVNVTVSGYVLQGGKITSDQLGNSFLIEKTAANAVTINNDFDILTNGTVNLRIRNSGGLANPLTIGGNYKFVDASGTKYLDLEGTHTSGSRIVFLGSLLNTPGATVRLRLGQAGTVPATEASVYDLYGDSSHAGGTHVVRGTVNVYNPNALGVGGVQLVTSVTSNGCTARLFLVGNIDLPSTAAITTANPKSGETATAVFGKGVGDVSTSTLNANFNLNADNTMVEVLVAEPGATLNFAGIIADGTGIRGFTKTGAGVLALTNAAGSAYDGTTLVAGGTLLVRNTSGSATGTGQVIVSNSATLGGSGRVGSVAVNDGGRLDPGLAGGTIGKLSITNLTLASGSETLVDVDAANNTNDVIVVVDSVTYGGTLIVTTNLAGTVANGQSFQIFLAGSATGNFTSISNRVPGVDSWTFNPANGTLTATVGPTQPTPTNITFSVVGGNKLVLNWPAGQGWVLQSNSVSIVASNAWYNVPGATPPWTNPISPTSPQVYFRLKY